MQAWSWVIVVLFVLAAAAGLFFWARRNGGALVAQLVSSMSLMQERTWVNVPGDPHAVQVVTETGLVKVTLPKGVTSDDVDAVGVSEGGYEVTVLHSIPDRLRG